MADGIVQAPRFGDQSPKVIVEFTHKFDGYSTPGGPRFNAGERAALPEEEARVALREGAAVRIQEATGYDAVSGKAITRSPHNKMVEAAPNK